MKWFPCRLKRRSGFLGHAAVNMQEAKTHLSRLVKEAAAGEPFVICKAGQCQVPDDFDLLAAAEIADLFEVA